MAKSINITLDKEDGVTREFLRDTCEELTKPYFDRKVYHLGLVSLNQIKFEGISNGK